MMINGKKATLFLLDDTGNVTKNLGHFDQVSIELELRPEDVQVKAGGTRVIDLTIPKEITIAGPYVQVDKIDETH